ncbi:RNA-directed DNA polymerase [Xanthomonas cannabis]|uniref:RNA-directed DNA polymerase n=1 Tax=Xanthomonas cannabis TaxID=1885674 RepID=UPI001E2A91CB|nr:RNA-directed DNA polymerase [Xanthomonas cannabis]MCC8444766.1 RNA-directed DNA polymerase [Xanthomonas cannabis]
MEKMDLIELSDLYLAYKKAKSDAFFEAIHFDALAFSRYEERLHKNLIKLHKDLKSGAWWRDSSRIGGFLFAPKGIALPKSWSDAGSHFSTLDPCEDWRSKAAMTQDQPTADFRLVMAASIEYQVISALWILKVGHVYEASLDKNLSYGNRLRRRSSWRDAAGEGGINKDSLGLFKPYFSAYQAWRENGLKAIRVAIDSGRSVIAATMDAKRYYHNVSPEFLLRADYLDSISISLSPEQYSFTRNFINSLNVWYKSTPDFLVRPEGAIPVGLSASKVIANVALSEFDRRMRDSISPAYYGRYVDDIFIVVENVDGISSSQDFFKDLAEQFGDGLTFDSDTSITRFAPSYLSDSKVIFSPEKQKVFNLSGEFGLDLVGQIEQQIRQRSSEYKLLPVIPETTEGMLAKALLTSSDASLEADALRKADAVSIRRLGFAMLLGDVEAHARDLNPGSWLRIRETFYGMVARYVITPTGIFDYFNYILRVVGLAVSCGDHIKAAGLIVKFSEVLALVVRTVDADPSKLQLMVQLYARNLFQVSLQSSTVKGFKIVPAYLVLLRKIKKLSSIQTPAISNSPLREASNRLLFSDMGRRPYKEMWINHPATKGPRSPRAPSDLAVQKELRLGGLRRFIEVAERDYKKIYWPGVAFATRPLTIYEMTTVAPDLLSSPTLLRGALFALRGARSRRNGAPTIVDVKERGAQSLLSVPSQQKERVRVAIVSYLTELSDWHSALMGRPNRSLVRYKRFNKVINHILASDTKVDYLVFPEASVPRRWAFSASAKLAKSGVSFMAGLENENASGVFYNDALVALSTKWPGYNSHISYIQPKMLPAHEERKALKKVGRNLRSVAIKRARPVYKHGEHFFGLLICSDLTNIDNRRCFQGQVDTLFTLEWNQDVNSFSSLVEAAAQDLHAYIVQVNSRQYGDSRVRAPAVETFRRDVVQVKGGDEDYFVVAPLNISEIKKFHHSKGAKGNWKPLPIGFSMSSERKRSVVNAAASKKVQEMKKKKD